MTRRKRAEPQEPAPATIDPFESYVVRWPGSELEAASIAPPGSRLSRLKEKTFLRCRRPVCLDCGMRMIPTVVEADTFNCLRCGHLQFMRQPAKKKGIRPGPKPRKPGNRQKKGGLR